MAERGATVVIADIRHDAAAAKAEEIEQRSGSRVRAARLDVTDPEAVRALAGSCGRVDVVVNNAGIATSAPTFELTDEAWRRTLDINLSGPFHVSREFGRLMRGRGGAIVNISSIAAFKATRPEVHVGYDVTKAGIIGLTRTLAAEWAREGIRVNAVAPGYTNTDILREVGAESPETVQAWKAQVPQHRLIEPAEIAEAVAFLASPAASAVTGHVLLADAGYTAW
ncbi:SDR family NAD(P)-dependent oxidoreductase [Prauserella flavalba]|uniref:SDR family NAD(P)-dependent oxidoreductase n=1 Tax=Prauserella flavalba TaxID=1477506 RepID=UPI0036E6850F